MYRLYFKRYFVWQKTRISNNLGEDLNFFEASDEEKYGVYINGEEVFFINPEGTIFNKDNDIGIITSNPKLISTPQNKRSLRYSSNFFMYVKINGNDFYLLRAPFSINDFINFNLQLKNVNLEIIANLKYLRNKPFNIMRLSSNFNNLDDLILILIINAYFINRHIIDEKLPV
jgi:hypothetical protein